MTEALEKAHLTKDDIDLLKGSDVTLARLSISEAEGDGTVQHCTSIWDEQNGSIRTGSDSHGPRIVNFADILKYDYFPAAQMLDELARGDKYMKMAYRPKRPAR